MNFDEEKEKRKYRIRFSGWMIFKIVVLITMILLALALLIAMVVFSVIK